MSAGGGPEWISKTIVEAAMYDPDGNLLGPAWIAVGRVRMPHGAGIRIAAQVEDEGRDLFVLPPSSTARAIGVLWEGLPKDLKDL